MSDDTIDMPTLYYHRSGNAFSDWTCTVEGPTTYCTAPESHWYDGLVAPTAIIALAVVIGIVAVRLALRFGANN